MKRLIILGLVLFSISLFAQEQTDTTENKIVVSEDVNECVQKIYDNPDALKLIITLLASDKEKMRQVHREIMNDPDIQQIMRDMRGQMHEENMRDNGMHDRMHHQQNQEMRSDTSGVR